MLPESLPDYILYLLKSSSSSDSIGVGELVQTHISYVTLLGAFVYKWKKPVDLGFLDFTRLESRKYFCEEEVRLNRRLCPEMYLDVVTINYDGKNYSLQGDGEIVEYGVKMVRLPESRMMNQAISSGWIDVKHLQHIVDLLVPFYENAKIGGIEDNFGHHETVAKAVHDNFEQTERFIGSNVLSVKTFEAIQKYSENFLKNDQLFVHRIEEERIRECHGDLHSGNICLTDNIQIFDCIEFSDSLRFTDVAADIAFLAMDLDYHGLFDLSNQFVTAFIERSKDYGIPDIIDFYKCYRAYVRGKISVFTANDPGVSSDDAAQAFLNARRFFTLAERYGA